MSSEEANENILYNVYSHKEWSVESEDVSFRIADSFNVSVWSLFRSAGSLIRSNVNNVVFPLDPSFLKIKQQSLDWKIAFNTQTKTLALLCDKEIVLLSFESGFNEVLANCTIPKELNPKWAIIEWSNNGQVLIHCSSKSLITVFDRKLNPLASIPITGTEVVQEYENPTLEIFETIDSANCVCSLQFKQENIANHEWVLHIYCLTYRGMIHSFLFESDSGEIQKSFSVNLTSYYSNGGVFCSVYSQLHNIFVTGTCFPLFNTPLMRESESKGLITWRLLNDSPWIASIDGGDLNSSFKSSKRRAWTFSKKTNECSDGTMSLVLSEDECFVYASHWLGCFTKWSLPAMLLVTRINSNDLCKVNTSDEYLNCNVTPSSSAFEDAIFNFRMWSENEIVFAKFSGLLDIHKIDDLGNISSLTGKCECFPSPVELSPVFKNQSDHKAFVGLEMEKRIATLKRQFNFNETSAPSEEDDDDSDDESYETIRQRSSRYLKKGLYFITESDHFQPPKKKPKMITKVFRVFSFQSTTPNALFKIKLQNEEFGEALTLAKQYKLDSDLVYMRQWRKYPVSNATIHDYLRKISKRHWILRECLSRFSDDLDATKALLNYGLLGTEIEVLINIGEMENSNKSSYNLVTEEEEIISEEDAHLSREQIEEKRKQHRLEKVKNLLKKFDDIKELNVEQKEILKTRRRLIHYLQMLLLYEQVLGGTETAVQNFSSDEYLKIRNQTLLKTTIEFARSCDASAVDTMFMYVEQLERFRLLVLSNFPETFQVAEYSDMLPNLNNDGSIAPLHVRQVYDLDWSIDERMLALFPDDNVFESVDLSVEASVVKPSVLNKDTCSDWYLWRAKLIENKTGLLSNSCDLLQIGVENNIPGLVQLLTDMSLLKSIVCEIQSNILIRFSSFETFSEFDKLNFILQSSNSETICRNIRKFIKPRLNTLSMKKHEDLFRQLLISLSMKDLTKLVKIYEASKPKLPDPLESNIQCLIRNAIDCIYNCPRTDQLSQAYTILNCLPSKASSISSGTHLEQLYDQVDCLKRHLECAAILDKYEIAKPVVFLKQVENDKTESLKLLNELVLAVVKKGKRMLREDFINFLNNDLLKIQRKMLSKVTGSETLRVFVTQLLRSDEVKLIKFAKDFMIFSATEKYSPFSYSNASSFKLSYDDSNDIIVNVAQEFVDSSSSVKDSSILTALSLLRCISNPPKVVQDEKDFIEMLTMLQQFNCSLLPVVIRTKYTVEQLITYLLKENPGSYVNHTRILRITSLFKIAQPQDGKILSELDKKARVCAIIAEHSLKDKYIDLALNMCLQLIDLSHGDAWKFCWKLVQLEELKDQTVKEKLLSFTMCYCPCDVLPKVVEYKAQNRKSWNKNESATQNVYMNGLSSGDDNVQLFPILGTLEKTTGKLLKETHQTTQQILSSQGLMLGSEPYGASFTESGLLGCCFYDTIPSVADINSIDKRLPDLDDCYSRLNSICDNITAVKADFNNASLTEAFVQCAIRCFDYDFNLALTFVLACNSETCISKVSESVKPGEKSLYFNLIALSLLNKMNKTDSSTDILAMLETSPRNIILTDLKTDSSDNISNALESLHVFVETKKLQQLATDIDISKFSTDHKYKRDTILKLAANTDAKLLALASELAVRHNVRKWEIHAETMVHVFTSEQFTTNDITKHIDDMKLIEKLSKNAHELVNRLEEDVYSSIRSDDLEKLALFFKVLTELKVDSKFGQKTSVHVRILEVLRNSAPLMPYKELLDEDSDRDCNKLIASFCTRRNYEELSQLLTRVSDSKNCINRSKIIYHYAARVFFDLAGGDCEDEEDISLIKTLIDCMKPEELKAFSELLAYQNDEIIVTNLNLIVLLVRKCLAVSRKGNKKKGSNTNAIQQVQNYIEDIFKEVEKLSKCSFMCEWLDGQNEVKSRAAKALWLSRGDLETQQEVLVGLVFNQISFDDVHKVIVSLSIKMTLDDIIELSMAQCTDDIASCEHIELEHTSKPLILLLTSVKEYMKQDNKTLIDEDRIITKLREITSHPNLSTVAKIYLLEKTENLFNLTENDLKSLLHARTKTLLTDVFSESVFTEDDLSSEEGRYSLICDLLDCSVNPSQFLRLTQLLDVWPKFSNFQANQHPFCAICCKWIQTDPKGSLQSLKPVLLQKDSDTSMREALSSIVDFCFDSDLNECGVVFGLLLNRSNLQFERIVDVLSRSNKEDDASVQLPEECYVNIIENKILPQLIHTKYYGLVTDYVIEQQSNTLLYKFVDQLISSGLKLEAADVLSRFSDYHQSFTTLTGTFSYLKSWFSLNRNNRHSTGGNGSMSS